MSSDGVGSQLRRFKNLVAVIAFAVTAVVGPTVAITLDDGLENTQSIKENAAEISTLKSEINRMKLELNRIEISFDPDKKSNGQRPGFCACIAKSNSVAESKKFLQCPAKNFVCDKESREICDKQHPDYDC